MVRGFYCRVKATGTKTFGLEYTHNGATRRYKIGNWPSWTVDEARTEARALKVRTDKGEDISATRASDRRKAMGETLETACEAWLDNTYRKTGAKILKPTEHLFRKSLYPALGDIPLAEITR